MDMQEIPADNALDSAFSNSSNEERSLPSLRDMPLENETCFEHTGFL